MWATAPPKPVPPPTRLEGPNRLRQGAAGQVPATLWSPPSPGTGSTWLRAPSSGDDPRRRPPSLPDQVTTAPRQPTGTSSSAHRLQSMAFRREPLRTDHPPGPGTYTLPRLMGPNTVYTSASPCYSVRGRSQRGRFDEDLAKTPGPAALPKVPVDAYKTRAPAYTMAARPKAGEGKAAKPGPADYSVGRVTLIKPQAPASTFGIRHSLYTTPLIVE
uniref:Outer dense fiber protein 3-like protein 2 n=3 Tax=Gallus gallus TaxID=9031 RepID=A0A8V1AM92_CHICK